MAMPTRSTTDSSAPAPAVVALTRSGLATARRLRGALPGARLHAPAARLPEADIAFADLTAHLRGLYAAGTPILAVCAAGIVVRALAPALADKRTEPPVVAVAEDGSCAVPLLGGHRGANRLARRAAEILNGTAAITTAGDLRLGLALDEPPDGWAVRNPEAAKPVAAALLAGAEVALTVEAGDPSWLLAGGARFAGAGAPGILLTDRDAPGDDGLLVLHPKLLALGVGCERGTSPGELIELAEATLAERGLARHSIACVASIDLKADEPAVHALAERLAVPARFFAAAELEAESPRLATPSELVFRETGCHGVAEGAALAAAGADAALIVPKRKSRRATCALARGPAPIDPLSAGRARGRLALVGLGPGGPAWRTTEADSLLAASTDIVGYGLYLDLLGPAATGKRLHPFRLGEEEHRCRHALDLAADGRAVALVCSGDPGIYAMAALVFELLERPTDPRWRRIAVTVAPGVSALQAAAARAGAPLGHDFCAVSLSDLLTPWPEIERRLHAAAEADFVVALYNPASRDRREGLRRAVAILAAARPPATPVVIARNLGRPGEAVETVRLADLDRDRIDMLTLVIVGSTRTRLALRPHGGAWVYTPRGYDP